MQSGYDLPVARSQMRLKFSFSLSEPCAIFTDPQNCLSLGVCEFGDKSIDVWTVEVIYKRKVLLQFVYMNRNDIM